MLKTPKIPLVKFKDIFFISFLLFFVSSKAQDSLRTKNFPKDKEYVKTFPAKEKVWVFIMAGQSNMAGRAIVEPQDTIPTEKVITLNNQNEWVVAKEPLHLYQPKLTGLDSGLSFAKHLRDSIPQDVTIALVPCAVGGSSVEYWLNDSIFNGVRLKSNFMEKVKLSQQVGKIKGVLWHQGEANAFTDKTEGYKEKLAQLFGFFRDFIGNDKLPLVIGELGSYPVKDSIRLNCHKINQDIIEMTESDPNIFLVHTEDLTFKGDHVHFDAKSQRILGERYAKVFERIISNKE